MNNALIDAIFFKKDFLLRDFAQAFMRHNDENIINKHIARTMDALDAPE